MPGAPGLEARRGPLELPLELLDGRQPPPREDPLQEAEHPPVDLEALHGHLAEQREAASLPAWIARVTRNLAVE